MRLLSTAALTLEYAAGDSTPIYAILSHTWGTEEVSLQELESGGLDPQSPQLARVRGAREKAGYAKIRSAIERARIDGIPYLWIDTCCIDKTSSAELTEAINSMYQWYQNARLCYAYLSDVPDGESDGSSFARSRWFTRGWTLQELLAPDEVIFYSQGWRLMGTKVELSAEISAVTGIDVEVLTGTSPHFMSVAKRMFWASKRKTTRLEDTAYCLMGLFDVNMPLLYGEGVKAFIRLQEEIMKTSDDQSLFAWKALDKTVSVSGMLAHSPASFLRSPNIVPTDSIHTYSITNRGLQMQTTLHHTTEPDLFLAPLNCTDTSNYLGPVVIFLRRIASQSDDQFVRFHDPSRPDFLPGLEYYLGLQRNRAIIRRPIYVVHSPKVMPMAPKKTISRVYGFCIRQSHETEPFQIMNVSSCENWNKETGVLEMVGKTVGIAGSFLCSDNRQNVFFVLTIGVGVDSFVTVRLQSLEIPAEWTIIAQRTEKMLEDDLAKVHEFAQSGTRAPQFALAFANKKEIFKDRKVMIQATAIQSWVEGKLMYVIELGRN